MDRNHCETIKTNKSGEQRVKSKKKFDSAEEALWAAKKVMIQPEITDKLIAYECTVCSKFHIGRNGRRINDIYKGKLKRQLEIKKRKEELDHLKNFKPKVVGKIDLSKIPKK